MKANELTIGQKYIWRRNSQTTHEAVYIGIDESGKYTLYVFEYEKEGNKYYTYLSVHHVDSDISHTRQTKFNYLESHYPDYYSCDKIALLLDMDAYLSGEIDKTDFLNRTKSEYNNITDPEIQSEFNVLMSDCLVNCELF